MERRVVVSGIEILVRRVWLVLLLGVPWVGGCASAGALGDVGASAISATAGLFTVGKLNRFEEVSLSDAIAATERTGGRLGLTLVEEKKHPDQRNLIFRDHRDQEITVTVVQRTPQVTEIRVDVGLFGPSPLGRLMMRTLLAELSKDGQRMPPRDRDEWRLWEEEDVMPSLLMVGGGPEGG